jgi:hypothetical protein
MPSLRGSGFTALFRAFTSILTSTERRQNFPKFLCELQHAPAGKNAFSDFQYPQLCPAIVLFLSDRRRELGEAIRVIDESLIAMVQVEPGPPHTVQQHPSFAHHHF